MLKVEIRSFSFHYDRASISQIDSLHGGGFVFDCRCLPNPGRLPIYKELTGKDAPVQEYLESNPEFNKFFEASLTIVKLAINQYLQRDFNLLEVNFGCTGGQHRSVYSAEKLFSTLTREFVGQNVEFNLSHIGLKRIEQDHE